MMSTSWKWKRQARRFGAVTLAAASCFAMSGFGTVEKSQADNASFNVPKAVCGPGDHPETGLQGQVPAQLRASGFQGFSCNLELISQVRGDGANWQSAEFRDARLNGDNRFVPKAGQICAYHGTSFTTKGRTHVGVPVIDISDPANPSTTSYLTTTSMLDPWESLKVNERRQLLAADNGHNAGGGPEVDIYDISGDCRYPQFQSSVAVGKADGSTGEPAKVTGHEGSWAPDGLTYYGGDIFGSQYYAVDMANPTAPKLLATWHTGISGVHGLSISDDGYRGYFVSLSGGVGAANLNDPNAVATNGLLIYDLTQIQDRMPNPQPKLVGKVMWKDGSFAQHTIPVKIRGRHYVISVDEGGSAGIFGGVSGLQAACDAGFSAFPMARIVDINDETNPRVISKLTLEIHNPANCAQVLPDLVGLSTFWYGSHYCSVDNRSNATTLACGYFNSGIRVFDIRDPQRPREIAYYNPAGTLNASPGSNHGANWKPGGADWCSAQVHLDADRGTLWTTCQDNGFLMLKFTHGAWPFPQSSNGLQN
jgi:hypothetical protein